MGFIYIKAKKLLFFIIQKQATSEKSDFWPAFFAGFGIAALALPILKNLSALDFLFSFNRGYMYGILVLWFVLMPVGAVFGVYLANIIGRKKPIISQLARYGLIGWFNVFFYAGTFNLLSWLTGISSGLAADFIIFISFVMTVTGSFFWNKYWVFASNNSWEGKTEYVKFFSITGFTAILNILIFHLVVNIVGVQAGLDEKIWANIAILIQIPVSFFGNFFGYKIFVFKNKGK